MNYCLVQEICLASHRHSDKISPSMSVTVSLLHWHLMTRNFAIQDDGREAEQIIIVCV